MPDPDNQLRWLNTCCPDWEGGFSMNPCCPASVSACVSLSKVGKLCGEIDPDDDPDVKRPTAYKEVISTLTTSVSICNADDDCTYPRPESTTRSGTTTSTRTSTTEYSVDEEGSCVAETTPFTYSGSSNYLQTQTCCPGFSGCGRDDFDCSSTQNEDGSWSGSETNCYYYPNQPNDPCFTYDINSPCFNPAFINTCPEPDVYTTTYDSPDTESAALSRVDEWTQGSSCTSSDYRVSAYNTGDKLGVSKTTVKYEAVITGLVIGFCYEGVIPIERALIDFDEQGNRIPPEPEDWLQFSLTAIDAFRAEQVFQIFGLGTLNVSDDDFISENFSLDPYDYPSYFPVDPETGILVDPDALVLTPFSDLPTSKVYDYRVQPAIIRRLECDEI